ncbi:bifunctional DNA primase/polymerase [Mycobacterium interjectum]|uniref:bifunctional DNA primase/polymerase n=1 Tax=Mycobacterium interjectum TaxID=33895 RepID=UPI0008322F78|nr:bifunctional DNA primase/polymerase [Mycobacterium interjectum]MCV7090210.1 bifunctional DNA primase/polymerase [Mycobacterium interjectum]
MTEVEHPEPIYATAYDLYRDRGWVPIKLRAGIKFPPPTGYTGRDGVDPSFADMHAWATDEPHGNIAIRLPADVIGIDVDAYDGETGAETLAEAEKRWGKLPHSPRSTSRDDGVSGIRLYRIPAGIELVSVLEFPELGIGDIEICQHHHRYVMGWPSRHPRGDTYRWLGIDNEPLAEPPALHDIPDLPAAWLEALRKPERNGADLGDHGPYNVRQALTEGEMSRRVAWRLGEAVAACYGPSRHDHTRDNVLGLLRYGKQGDFGVLPALKALQKAFVAAVGPDRPGGHTQASEEFRNFVNSDRAAQLLAEPDHDEWTHELGNPPSDPEDRHPGEYHGPQDRADQADAAEGAIQHRMTVLRINREAQRRLDDEENPPTALPAVKNLDALLGEPDTPVRYRIEEVAPADSRVIFSAQYKAGKTTALGNLLRSLVDGDDFLGAFTVNSTARRVVLIDDELSESTLRRWLRDQNIINTAAVADVVTLRGKVASFNLLDDRCRDMWATRLRDLGCDYLMLDCLRPVLDALGLDENHDAGQFLTAYDALLHDAGVPDSALVQHMGHTSERARGDSRLQDWPDAIWRIVRETEEPDSPRYFTAYGRDVSVAEGRLSYDPDTRRLTYAAGSRTDARVEAAKLAIIKVLAEQGNGEPLSVRALQDALNGEHSQKSVRAGAKQAIKDRLVTVADGPRGAKLHSIYRACSQCGLPVAVGRERHESCPTPEQREDGIF